MRTIYFDDGTRWDDPNARWGDPSYLLEPGDPGYVAPAGPLSQPQTHRRRTVKRSPFWPRKTADQVTMLLNFATKLPPYQAALALAAAQVTAAVADAQWVAYVLGQFVPAQRTFSEAVTDGVETALRGDGTLVMALPAFTVPALPAGVVPTNTGALTRLFNVFQLIKDNSLATDDIQSDLGLVGDEITGPDYNTIAPQFKAVRTATGVHLDWSYGKWRDFFDMVEMQVDRGTGWEFLANDTTPGYDDSAPQPAPLTKWKYRMIFHVDDQRVGQWSAEQTVTVGG